MATRNYKEVEYKQILHIDMDGVLANFLGSTEIPDHEKEDRNHPAMYKPGFFENLPVNEGAIEAVEALMLSGKYEIWICTKPVYNSSHCYKEKAQWVMKHFPALAKRIIMTQDKSLIRGHWLIDDDINNMGFEGTFMLFDPKQTKRHWAAALEVLL